MVVSHDLVKDSLIVLELAFHGVMAVTFFKEDLAVFIGFYNLSSTLTFLFGVCFLTRGVLVHQCCFVVAINISNLLNALNWLVKIEISESYSILLLYERVMRYVMVL